jgi:hypothetical protein
MSVEKPATKTLQFFLNELRSKLSEASQKAIASGDENAVLVLDQPMSAIDPTDGDHRAKVARFRGSLADRLALESRSYRAYAIPAGVEMRQAVGANGVTVAGNSVFLAVPTSVLVAENDLGSGDSAQIREAFVTWSESQG